MPLLDFPEGVRKSQGDNPRLPYSNAAHAGWDFNEFKLPKDKERNPFYVSVLNVILAKFYFHITEDRMGYLLLIL